MQNAEGQCEKAQTFPHPNSHICISLTITHPSKKTHNPCPSRNSRTQPCFAHDTQASKLHSKHRESRSAILDAALSAGMPFHTFAHERLCVSLSLPPKRRCAGSLPHLTSVPRFRLFKWGGRRERRRVRGKMSSGLALVPVVAG